MAPTNVKTIHQTSSLHMENNPDRLELLSPSHGQRSQQQSGQITLEPVLINKPKFLKATHHTETMKIVPGSTEVHGGGGLEPVKPAREPSSTRVKPRVLLKNAPRILPVCRSFFALVGKKTDRGQRSAFPSETLRFAPLILVHKGSALPWLVDDRASLRPLSTWCLLTR